MPRTRQVERIGLEGAFGIGERHAVTAGDEQARGERGEPALMRAATEVAGEFLLIGVSSVFDERFQIVLDGGEVFDEIVDERIVGDGAHGGEHALRVPIPRVELDGLAQVILSLGEQLLGLCLGGGEGCAVICELGRHGDEVERSVPIGVDEGRRVEAVGLAGALDEGSVPRGVGAFALHGGEDESQAVLLDGVECHVAPSRYGMGARPRARRCRWFDGVSPRDGAAVIVARRVSMTF